MNWYKIAANEEWNKYPYYHVFMIIASSYPRALTVNDATGESIYIPGNDSSDKLLAFAKNLKNFSTILPLKLFYKQKTYEIAIRWRNQFAGSVQQDSVTNSPDIRVFDAANPTEFVTKMEQAIKDIGNDDNDGDTPSPVAPVESPELVSV